MLGAATLAQLHKHVGDDVTVGDGGARPFPAADRRHRHAALVRRRRPPCTPRWAPARCCPTGSSRAPPASQPEQHPGHPAARGEPRRGPRRCCSGWFLRATRRRGATRAAPGRDRQLPVHGDHPAHTWARPWPPGRVAALCLTLIASVRRRRRDLALLKTLGFTRRQLAAAVAWQSTIAVALGAVVGVPAGHRAGPRPVGPVRRGRSASCPSRPCPACRSCSSSSGRWCWPTSWPRCPGAWPRARPAALLLRAE